MERHHITDMLDNTPLASLSESERESIRAHAANCSDCARAFKAAQLSELLIKEHASEAARDALNANPFFQTRVLAAWREQQIAASAWSFRRLWNATGALVSSMAATTAILAALTFVIPAEETATVQTAALMPASAESVMLEQGEEEMTNEQALSAIYYEDEEAR
jgi:hypothetical protein